MDRMTPEMGFRARELSAGGIWSGRIAEMLGVDEREVRRAVSGETFEEPQRESEPTRAPTPVAAPRVVDPNEWPAPEDEHYRSCGHEPGVFAQPLRELLELRQVALDPLGGLGGVGG